MVLDIVSDHVLYNVIWLSYVGFALTLSRSPEIFLYVQRRVWSFLTFHL